MSLLELESVDKNYNYAYSTEKKCMNCGGLIETADNIYSRRFCSEKCKLDYLLE